MSSDTKPTMVQDVVVLAWRQPIYKMSKRLKEKAIHVAEKIMENPGRLELSPIEKSAVAAYVMWASQRIDAIRQCVSDKDLRLEL